MLYQGRGLGQVTRTMCVSEHTVSPGLRALWPSPSLQGKEAEACSQVTQRIPGGWPGLRPNVPITLVLLLTKDSLLCHGWRQPPANMSIRRNNLHSVKRCLSTLFSSELIAQSRPSTSQRGPGPGLLGKGATQKPPVVPDNRANTFTSIHTSPQKQNKQEHT